MSDKTQLEGNMGSRPVPSLDDFVDEEEEAESNLSEEEAEREYFEEQVAFFFDGEVSFPGSDTTDAFFSSDEEESALDVQEGEGDHYNRWSIQPITFIHENGLGFIRGNVIKYIMRYDEKNGREDLEKVKHYIDLLIELEYDQNEVSDADQRNDSSERDSSTPANGHG